ncbi:alpha/beta fold hydrolase [Streptomyces sp. NPDC006879]|uniref:alpha/beta fold hydrolase n=1 Tax=Streptomyces sp. NPDC006879 TaxID=3364767 RepID=UPI00367E1177
MTQSQPIRSELTLQHGRRLSYLQFGAPGSGRPLLALHGHLSEGASFTHLATALGPDWQVIAPDQRGHGDSDRAADYSRAGYVSDLVALLEHLALDVPPPVLGHSLGGINAYYLAAEHPGLVSALINVDAPVDIPHSEPSPMAFLADFPYTAPTRAELLAACAPIAPMVEHTLRPLPDGSGWRLPSHPKDMLDSERQVPGDHWKQWSGSDCPALLIHGAHSQVLSEEQARAMVQRRPVTSARRLETDHFVQMQDPRGFERAVREFLTAL